MIMNIYVPDKDFFASLTFDQEMLVQGHCTPSTKGFYAGEVWKKIGQREGNIWSGQGFNKLDYYD